MAAQLYKMRRLLLPLLLASTTAAKSTYWKEVEAKKRRPAAAAYCPKRCFTTEASGDERRVQTSFFLHEERWRPK